MKKTKSIIAVLLTISLLTCGVFASFEENVKEKNINFANDLSATDWLFNECKEVPSRTMTLEAEDFHVTFKGSDLGSIPAYRYSFEYKQRADNFGYYNILAGSDAPKLVVNFNDGKSLPGACTLTVLNSSFAPYTTQRVYKIGEGYSYTLISDDVKIGKNGSFSFPVTEGGEFFITPVDLSKKTDTNYYFDLSIPTADEIISGVTTQKSKIASSKEPIINLLDDKYNPTTGAVC